MAGRQNVIDESIRILFRNRYALKNAQTVRGLLSKRFPDILAEEMGRAILAVHSYITADIASTAPKPNRHQRRARAKAGV